MPQKNSGQNVVLKKMLLTKFEKTPAECKG